MIPLGERAWRSILAHVVATGDAAETTYLEVKSDLDLTSKAAVAKVAKFLLAAANRRPKEAAQHFQGYAVLVIGAKKGDEAGVPGGMEPHELEDRLRPYLGPQFPAFEFGRIAVDHGREVLFVIAQPPKDGQSIFPCYKDFQGENSRDNLADGAIYVRGTSNSRVARGGEVLALVERARGCGEPPISLEVQVLGTINRIDRVSEVMEILYQYEEKRFNEPEPPAQNRSPLAALVPSAIGRARPLTAEERAQRLAGWKTARPKHLARGRDYFLGLALPGAGIRVISRDRSVSKPELIVVFHDCEAFEYRDRNNANLEKVVEPIIRKQDPYGIPQLDPDDLQLSRRGDPVAWKNSGNDVEVTLTPESFRPNTPWATDEDDYVVVARDPQTTNIFVTWTLTEYGKHAVTSGQLAVVPGYRVDAGELFGEVFRPSR